MKVVTTNRLNRFWTNGVKPIKDALTNKLNISNVVNNLTTTASGKALDARQGKALDDKISALNSNLSNSIGVLSNVKGIYVGSKVAACNQSYALIFGDAALQTILGKAPTTTNFVCFVMNGDATSAQTSYYSPRYFPGDGLYAYVYPNVTGSIRINYAIFAIE